MNVLTRLRGAVSTRSGLNRLWRELQELRAHLKRVRRDLDRGASRQDERWKSQYEQGLRIEERLNALSRAAYLNRFPLKPPHDLTVHRFRAFSQNGEDGLALEIFRRIGTAEGKFVDIGCGVKGGNSRFFAEELGWTGILVDARPEVEKLGGLFPPGQVTALPMWITRENLNTVVQEHHLGGEIDLLSIDVDGVDYWLWEAMTACSPRLVIIEYNSLFGPHVAVTVPYAADFNRHARNVRYHGASLAALVFLGKRKGYRLVAVEPAGVNAFFVRNDLGPSLPGFEAHEIFRRKRPHQIQILAGDFDIRQFVPENGLPLIDVAASGDGTALWSGAQPA